MYIGVDCKYSVVQQISRACLPFSGCGLWDFSSLTRIGPAPSAVKAWNPTDWTTREFPSAVLLT